MALSGKKLLIGGFVVALLIGIPLTVYLVQQQQATQSHAAKSTTLGFDPASTTTAPLSVQSGQQVKLNITINPGSNQVAFVKLDIAYDPQLSVDQNAFVTNDKIFPSIIEGPTFTPGHMTVSVSIGTDLTKIVQTPTTVGTLTLTAKSGTGNTPAIVQFGPKTEVLSAASSDQRNENVLSTSTPAAIAISGETVPTPTGGFNPGGGTGTPGPTGGACANAPDQVQNVRITYPQCTGNQCDFTKASCTWDALTGATSYTITISQVNADGSLTLVKSDTATNTGPYVFAVQQNNSYECDVSAVNSCGAGKPGTITALCAAAANVTTPTVAPTGGAAVAAGQPTNPANPANPANPTSVPQNQVPVTGNTTPLMLGAGIVSVLTFIGAALFFLL